MTNMASEYLCSSPSPLVFSFTLNKCALERKSGVYRACLQVYLCPFSGDVTPRVSLTGLLPRRPQCHPTLQARSSHEANRRWHTWNADLVGCSPSGASGCCSFSHRSSMLPCTISFFFNILQKKRLLLSLLTSWFTATFFSPKMIKEITTYFPGHWTGLQPSSLLAPPL